MDKSKQYSGYALTLVQEALPTAFHCSNTAMVDCILGFMYEKHDAFSPKHLASMVQMSFRPPEREMWEYIEDNPTMIAHCVDNWNVDPSSLLTWFCTIALPKMVRVLIQMKADVNGKSLPNRIYIFA